MSLNWVEIDRVLEEMNLDGAFLQGVRQAEFRRFYFDFYQPGRPVLVLVSLEPGRLRLHPALSKPAAPPRPPRFVEFLRSRLVGSRLIDARQFGRERVVVFRFASPEGELSLVARLWGGAANLIVLDDKNRILEAAFRRPASGEIKGGVFRFPEATASGKVFGLRDLPGEGTYGERIGAFYDRGAADVEELRVRAFQILARQENALAVQRERVNARLAEGGKAEDWKTWGDILTSNAWKIEAGASRFEGEDWRDGSTVIIPLETKLDPHENATLWYKKAHKVREAAELAVHESKRLDVEASALERHRSAVATADAEFLLAFLAKAREVKVQNERNEGERPGLEFRSGAFTLWVGRNARENDALLRRWVRGGDLWFHTRDVPGGFVFVRSIKGKSVPLETLLDAGNLAVWFSKAKGEGKADLYYTHVKYLRRAKDGPLGLVLPTQEKNLTVRLDKLRLDRILREKEEVV